LSAIIFAMHDHWYSHNLCYIRRYYITKAVYQMWSESHYSRVLSYRIRPEVVRAM